MLNESMINIVVCIKNVGLMSIEESSIRIYMQYAYFDDSREIDS